MITNTDYVSSRKSKGLSAESIKPTTTSDNVFTPALNYYGTKTRVKFTGTCLKWKSRKWKIKVYSWKSNKHLHCL